MTYRSSAIFRQGASNGPSVQLTVPAAEAGNVQAFLVIRSGTNAGPVTVAVSEGEDFVQVLPADGTIGSVGSQSKYAVFARETGAELGGGVVTVTTGAEGRYVSPIVVLSDADIDSIVLVTSAPGAGTSYGCPSATPPPGTVAGTAVYFAAGSASNSINTFTFPGDVIEREQSSTQGASLINVWAALATKEFTGDAAVPGVTLTGSVSTTNKRTVTMLVSGAAMPTLNVTTPADASVQVGGSQFALPGQVVASGGATVTSRLWTDPAGVDVTLTNATSDTVLVTPPAAVGSGSTTFRLTATGTPGSLTDFDETVITWTAASTGPVPYTAGPGWVDARAAGTPVSLAPLDAPGVAIVEACEGVFLLSAPGTFTLSADNGSATSVTVTVLGIGGDEGLVDLYVDNGTSWEPTP